MQITFESVPINLLHEDPYNARAHSDRNLAAIKGSLERFGQVEPLVVQAETGKVIGGNGRLAVMKELGWTQVKVNLIEGLSDHEAAALGVALNRTAELATWNSENLRMLLDSLPDGGANFADFGFELPELKTFANIDSVTAGDINPEEEWTGMPDYSSENKDGKYKFIFHSNDDEFVESLSKMVGFEITTKTRTVWYPAEVPDAVKNLEWVADEK